MFQKIAKHRANNASNNVHRPPLGSRRGDCTDDDDHGVADLEWRPPGGPCCWYFAPYNPIPQTGTNKRFVPCINSSLIFTCVSVSRLAILTPSSAFLLCALKNDR